MLFLTRKPGQSLVIRPQPSLDSETPVAHLFAEGPIRIQVVGVHGPQVRLGVAAHTGLHILRDELAPHMVGALPVGTRLALAGKLKVLMFLRRHSAESLAAVAGLPLERVVAARSGEGVLDIDDPEKLATTLGVRVAELFQPVGLTAEERVVLALLEED